MTVDYHSRPEISNSQLSTLINDGPQMYYATYIAPEGERLQRKVTPAMQFGTDVHDYVLEPKAFVEIPRDALSSSGSRAGSAWKQFEAENSGKRLMKASEISEVKAIAKSLESVELSRMLLWEVEGCNEVAMDGVDDITKLKLRGKLDRLIDSRNRIVDLKVTNSIKPGVVAAHFMEMGYHRQQHFYRWLVSQNKGIDFDDLIFNFVAVRSEPPYEVQVFQMDSTLAALGAEQVRNGLDDLKRRLDTGDWRSPTEDQILTLEAPRWATKSR